MEEKQKIENFTDLRAWKEAHTLVLLIYSITKKYPKEELFGLVSQMRRAVISVTSNTAEGFSRASNKDKNQFYSIAMGSLTELQNQLLASKDIGYISEADFVSSYAQSTEAKKVLSGLKRIYYA